VKVQKERKRKQVVEEFVQEIKTYKQFIKCFSFIGKLHIYQKRYTFKKLRREEKRK